MQVLRLVPDKWLSSWAMMVGLIVTASALSGEFHPLIGLMMAGITLFWCYQFVVTQCLYTSINAIKAIRILESQPQKKSEPANLHPKESYQLLINQTWYPAELCGQTMMSTWLVTLTWKVDTSTAPNFKKYHSVIRLNGALDAYSFSDLKRHLLSK